MTNTPPEITFAQRFKNGETISDESGEIIAKSYEGDAIVTLLVIACPSIAEEKSSGFDVVEIISNSKRNFYRKKIVKAIQTIQSWGLHVEVELFVSNIQPILHRLAQEVGDIDTFVNAICATEEIYQTIGHFLTQILGCENCLTIATPYISDDDQNPSVDTILDKSFERIRKNIIKEHPLEKTENGETSAYYINEKHHNHLELVSDIDPTLSIENLDAEVLEAVSRFKNLITRMSQLDINWSEMKDGGEEFLLALYAIDTLHLMHEMFNDEQVAVWMSIQKNDIQNHLIQKSVEQVNQGEVPFPVILSID